MIPYSTADLLAQNVTPFWAWDGEPVIASKDSSRDYSNCGSGSARKRRERFAPHLEAIKKMKKCGASWKQISVKTGIPKTTLALYWQDNPHLFGD